MTAPPPPPHGGHGAAPPPYGQQSPVPPVPPPPPGGGQGSYPPQQLYPPQGPYGQQGAEYGPYNPQGPYGAPPMGGGGWGEPPPTAPLPPRKTTGKKVGIGIGIAIALLLLFSGLREVYAGGSSEGDSSDSDSSADKYNGPTYTLTVPKTVLGGKFTLKKDSGDDPGGGEEAGSVRNELAFYETASGDRQLIVGAMHSRDENPEYPKYAMLDTSGNDRSVEVTVPRRKITPVKGDPLACEVQSKTESGNGGDKVTVPVCSWIDPHTQGMVADNSQSVRSKDPSDVDLDAFAKEAAGVRDEMRAEADG